MAMNIGNTQTNTKYCKNNNILRTNRLVERTSLKHQGKLTRRDDSRAAWATICLTPFIQNSLFDKKINKISIEQ